MSVPIFQTSSNNSPVYTHRLNRLYLTLRIILTLLVTFPLITILIAGGIDLTENNEWNLQNSLIFLLLLVLFIWFWYWLVFPVARNIGKRVHIYQDRFVISHFSKKSTIPFNDTVQVYTKWGMKLENLQYRAKVLKLRIVLKDGSEHSLNWGIGKLEQLEAFLQQHVADRFLPQAFQAIQQGQTISLGENLQINQQGITTSKGTLPWFQVQRGYMNKKHLLILQKGQAGAWDAININTTPNRMIIEALINTLAR